MRQRPLLTNTAEGRLRRRAARGGEEGEWAVVAGFPTSPRRPPRARLSERRAARRGTRDALWPSRRRRRRLPSLAEAALRAGQGQAAPRAVRMPEGGPCGVMECHAHSSLGWAAGRKVPDDQGWCRGGWEGGHAGRGRPTPRGYQGRSRVAKTLAARPWLSCRGATAPPTPWGHSTAPCQLC